MNLPKHEKCTGCGSCAAVCPKGCIRMVADQEGFLYPEVDESQCVSCKICEKACAVLNSPKVSDSVELLAAQNTDALVRQDSSSGGVFTALAQRVLQAGGAVCGAVYNEKFMVEHRIAFTMDEVVPMRGAKYAQSHAGHLFRQLKQLLTEGKQVMFVGTPCQCAGLKAYLGQDYDQLLTVDMICHGVPAPAVFNSYVNRRRELDANGAPVASINLRNKSTGWSNYAYSVMFQYTDGSVYSAPQREDPYMRGFVGNLYLRPSCSDCSFKGIHRCSDLTLGDCWGIWNTHPEFDDNKGTSLLLIHSSRGQSVWEGISDGFSIVSLTQEEAFDNNPSALTSSHAHPRREAIFAGLSEAKPVDKLIRDILEPKPHRSSLIQRVWRCVHKNRSDSTTDGGR